MGKLATVVLTCGLPEVYVILVKGNTLVVAVVISVSSNPFNSHFCK